MPELPEVETIRIQLDKVLPRLVIKDVEVRSSKVFQGDKRVLIGKKILGLRRFAKVLIIDLSGGLSLAVHLKMTGRLVYQQLKVKSAKLKVDWDVDYPTDKHTHVVITFTNGDRLYYHDQRKFGWLRVLTTTKVLELPFLAALGPEFFRGLTLSKFKDILAKNSRPIKLVLMDQEKLAGVGNIYANEGLWCAKINPKTPAKTLSSKQSAMLFACLEKVLKAAIKWKGASDDNYRDAFGAKGQVQEHFQVYNRAGRSCPHCRTPISKITLGGRGTYYCPRCQAGV